VLSHPNYLSENTIEAQDQTGEQIQARFAKVNLLLRTLISRPELTYYIKSLTIYGEHPYVPELLYDFNLLELELLMKLDEWNGLKLGSVEAFCFAVFRLSNPKDFNLMTNREDSILDLSPFLESQISRLQVEQIRLGWMDSRQLLKVPAFDISSQCLKNIEFDGFGISTLNLQFVQDLKLSGFVKTFFLPRLVRFWYSIEDRVLIERFSMQTFVDALNPCRETLEFLYLSSSEIGFNHLTVDEVDEQEIDREGTEKNRTCAWFAEWIYEFTPLVSSRRFTVKAIG
jgi:hypothetical protein